MGGIRRDHVEAFIAGQLAQWKPKTARIRYGNLQQFFKWCMEEDLVTDSPMRHVRAPSVPEEAVPIVPDDQVRRILGVVAGTSFEHRRDTAVLRILYDCGVRLAEVTGLHVKDFDVERQIVVVVGKGSRPRPVPFGASTMRP